MRGALILGLALLVPGAATAGFIPGPYPLPDAAVDGPPEVVQGMPYAGVCGGLAPEGTACTTGAHTKTGLPGSALSYSGFVTHGYTGTLESHLTWPGAEHFIVCDVVDDHVVGCAITGAGLWPPPGQPFLHTCASYDLGTTTRGGAGLWLCLLSHDIPLVA